MENKFKVRISRMFHNSCKSRDDTVEKSPFLTRSASMPAAPPPKPLPRPSICKPRTPPSLHINNACIVSSKGARSLVPLTNNNRASPRELESKSNSPVSPVKHFACRTLYDCGGTRYYAMDDDYGKKKNKKKNKAKAFPSFDYHDFFCGDDEKEDEDDDEGEDDLRTTDTLFSSMSLSSSGSSENRHRMSRSNTTTRTTHQRKELGEDGRGVGGSFAVMKKSRDPYGDFRKSMVEMITERQIFDEEELKKLLVCFLSLNSSHHHKIIIQVFNEIWDALH